MTVRIDTLRNKIAGTGLLLEMLGQELEDLHLLAYERTRSADEAHVKGGSRDYALDNHGDARARTAYRRVGEVTEDVCSRVDSAVSDMLKLLREGNTPGRTRRTLHLVELGEAIAAHSRRVRRGDYSAVRRGPQPDENRALSEVVSERDALNRKLTAANKEIARLTTERITRAERNTRRGGPSTSRLDQVL